MHTVGWLMLALSCSFQLLCVFSVARWLQSSAGSPGADARWPAGPNASALLRRLLQLRGVFVPDAQTVAAVNATGVPTFVDLRLAAVAKGKRQVLTVESGGQLRQEVNLGLRRMWAAYATWDAAAPEFEPRLADSLEAFGCRLALLPCASRRWPEMSDYCQDRGFHRGKAGLLVTHPDSTGLQDIALTFSPDADPSAVLSRLAARVSGRVLEWQEPPSALASEVGLLAAAPPWPAQTPLMLAALSVEFDGRLGFWRRRLDTEGAQDGLTFTIVAPEGGHALSSSDTGAPDSLRLLLASVAPDVWQAGWAAAALLNFALLPLPALLPGGDWPARAAAALRLAVRCNLVLAAAVAAVRAALSAVSGTAVGDAIGATWRHLVLSDFGRLVRSDWHLGAYPAGGFLAAYLAVCCLVCWHRPLRLGPEYDVAEAGQGGGYAVMAGGAAQPTESQAPNETAVALDAAGRPMDESVPLSMLPGAVSTGGAGSAATAAAAASLPAGVGDDNSDAGSGSSDDAEEAASLELIFESLSTPSLWIPQRDPERCLTRLVQWTCRVAPCGSGGAGGADTCDWGSTTASDSATTPAAEEDGDNGGDGWPDGTIRASHCPVCLDRYRRGHQLVALRCGHVFHRGCAAGWLVGHSSCPVCRRCPYRRVADSAGPGSLVAASGIAI